MKICPYCATQNRDDAPVCYACGRAFADPIYPPEDDDTEPTQPLHVRRGDPYQPASPPTNPPGQRGWDPQPGWDSQPGGWDTQPLPSQPVYPPQGGYGQQQGYPPQGGYGPQPGYPPPQGGYNQPQGGYYPPQGGYMPPQGGYAQPAVPPRRRRFWPVLLGTLAVMLLCACGLAAWTLASFTGGLRGLGGPALPVPQEQPSPWPTFTPEPGAPANPTPDPNAEKLLSPECRAALDALGGLSGQISSDPLKMLDSGWRTTLEQSVADMKVKCGTLDAASPVPGLVGEAQQDLDQAGQSFDDARRLFNEGVTGLNPGKIIEAGRQVGQATQFLNQAITAIRQIGR